MLLLDDDIIVSQAYYSTSPLFAFDSSSLVDLQQLLQSEAFKQNMSLTLNISTENLTDLLNTAQLNQTRELPQQQLSMSVLITLTVFYAIIFVAGVLGNLITCIVISRNKFMHTATNFYLFNLAVSDLMLLLSGAPQDVYSYWYPNAFPFGDAIRILGSVLAETATNATVLTITAFTVERYIAICHPFRQHHAHNKGNELSQLQLSTTTAQGSIHPLKLNNMFSHALSLRPQLATIAIAASTLATASTSNEMLLLDDDIIVSPSYYSNSPLFAFDSSSLVDLQQLLQSEAFKQNMSLTLNISTENLTDLLNTAQLNQTRELPQQQLSMSVLITLTVFYAIIFVAGVLGNLITCIVISRNKFMHTATNFYLFNLAVSDLMLLLSGAPQDVYSYWYPNAFPFGDAICILGSVLAETATNATVLTITAFTVERYIAICHPFRQHTMSKLSRAIKFIFAIWVTALLLALPQAMQFSVVSEQGGTSCTIGNHFVEHVFAVSGFIFFGGPMTAICVLYVLIGIKLKRSRLLQAMPRRSLDVHRGISAQSRVIRMLVAVAVAFFLCWAPFHAQRLMAVYGSSANIESQLFKDVFEAVDLTSGVLYYLSTCINPLLYNIMSHKFRDAFKVTLARQFGFPGRSQSQSHNYSALLRQNGSMRLHTTVNNNALDHYHSYRVMQLHCRDQSHHLSLQDSIRTTTTTTTINSSGGMGSITMGGMGGNSVSRRSSHRSRYTSIGSQSPLTTTLTKRDEKATNQVNGATAATTTKQQQQQQHHHMLQSQLSQRSNGADSNLLLDMELGTAHNYCHGHPQSSAINCNRSDNLRRSVISNSMVHAAHKTRPLSADRMSINSQEWDSSASQYELGDTLCMGELESELAKSSTPNSLTITRMPGVSTAPAIQPVNSIAELDVHAPARTRLKLSRIISRRDQDTLLAKSMPRAELMRSAANMPNVPDSPFTTYENEKKKQARNANGGRTHKTFDALTGIFHWRARKKELNGRHICRGIAGEGAGAGAGGSGSGRSRQTSVATTNTHPGSTSTSTPRMALMRSISSASPAMLESTLNAEMIGQKL